MRLLAIRLIRIFIMLLIYNDFSEACISHKIIISPRWEVSCFEIRLWLEDLELTASFLLSCEILGKRYFEISKVNAKDRQPSFSQQS